MDIISSDLNSFIKSCESTLRNNRRTSVEIELRYYGKISEYCFNEIIDKLGYEETVKTVTISNIINNVRLEKNIETKLQTYIEKTTVAKCKWRKQDSSSNFNLVLATEKPKEPCKLHNNSMVRAKKRYIIPLTKNWRCDMTIVNEFTLDNDLPDNTKSFFKICGGSDRLEDISGDEDDEDLEFTKKPKEINLDKISSVFPNVKLELEFEFLGKIITKDSFNDLHKYIDIIDESFKTLQDFNGALTYVKNLLSTRHNRADSLKNILPNAVTLSKNDYSKIFPPISYIVTEKLDGTRCIIILSATELVILTDEILHFDVNIPVNGTTVMDCELIFHRKPTKWVYAAYAFDVLQVEGENVCELDMLSRLAKLHPFISKLEKKKLPIILESKVYTTITSEMNEFEKVYNEKHVSEIDGLIMVSPTNGYEKTLNYKWKPLTALTIDFLSLKIGETDGISKYILLLGISSKLKSHINIDFCEELLDIISERMDVRHKLGLDRNYFPIQFSPPSGEDLFENKPYIYETDDGDLDYKILEMKFNSNEWELVRIREDRQSLLNSGNYFGNSFSNAIMVWASILDPLTLENLNIQPESYFEKEKDSSFSKQIKAFAMVKTATMQQIKDSETILDVGIGHGQDLNRYLSEINPKILYGIDNDSVALTELTKRWFTISDVVKTSGGIRKYTWSKNSRTRLKWFKIDMTDNYKEILQKINQSVPKFKVDTVVFNLSFSYFASDIATLKNIVSFCSETTDRVMINTIDGEHLHGLLKKNSGSAEIIEKSRRKYYIESIYPPNEELKDSGQSVRVSLPFREELYTEWLVNINVLTKLFSEVGFYVKYKKPFSEISNFKSLNLTEGDLFWVGLWINIVFAR